MKEEKLEKSIDVLLREVFEEEAPVSNEITKSMASDNDTKADEAIKDAPKGEKDEKRNAGRPKQISDVPQIDEDGKREGKYDDEIKENEDEEEENKEKDQVKVPVQMKKALTDEEFEEYQALKKAKIEAEEQKKADELKKAQESLIKAAVDAQTSELRKSLDDMRKVAQEQANLLKSIARTPVQPKSVQGIEALEKSSGESTTRTFTKEEMLDAAEELVKSRQMPDEVVIELENTGTVYDKRYRTLIEKQLNKK